MNKKSWSNEEIVFLKNNYFTLNSREIATHLNRSIKSVNHKMCRIGVSLHPVDKTSIVLQNYSLEEYENKPINYFIAGLVAGEATFTSSKTITKIRRFRFCIHMSQVDTDLVKSLPNIFKCGKVYNRDSQNIKHQPTIIYIVQDNKSLYTNIIPFMDKFLFDSNKKIQYNNWKKQFFKQYNIGDYSISSSA